MRVVRSAPDHEVPRGVIAGAEVSHETAGADNLFMGIFRVPPGAQSRPHYHANCESACYMVSGSMEIRWGERLEEAVRLDVGDLLYVPPHETHVLRNLSDTEPAEYVVARNSPTEDSVEVPWAGDSAL